MSKKPTKNARPVRTTPSSPEPGPPQPAAPRAETQGWQASGDQPSNARDERTAQILRRVWRGVPLAGVLIAIVVAFTHGIAVAVLVLAGTAMLVAIGAIWASLQVLAGDRPEGLDGAVQLMVSGGESEQKAFLLRALKDLDFERSLGKISDDDYEELKGQYRARAKAVLQELDKQNESARAEAERLAAEWLSSRGFAVNVGATEAVPAEATPGSEIEPNPPVRDAANDRRVCSTCGTDNESDARFCKKCGGSMEGVQGDETVRSEG